MKLSSTISRIFGAKSARISPAERSESGASSYFLVIFDAKHGTLVSERRIVDSGDAMSAFAEAERQYRGKPELQVVMFSADSIETVHGTHPHYFKGPAGPSTDPFGYKPVATVH
jgi:hypothetical protein